MRGKPREGVQSRSRVGVLQNVDPNEMLAGESADKGNVVAQNIDERAGSDDKLAAAAADAAGPKVKTFTADGVEWWNNDPFGLKRAGLYGQRGRLALRYEDLERHAQFRGKPAGATYLESVIHGPDPSAPASMVSTVSGETISSLFVRTAMIAEDGDLVRDKDGVVVYRGQFVVTGKPLTVHASEVGDNLYKLRNARGKKKTLDNGRVVADLLPSQSFDQANARLAGIQSHFSEKSAQNEAFKDRLGFGGDQGGGINRPRRAEDGIDRGAATPRTPRGMTRQGQ